MRNIKKEYKKYVVSYFLIYIIINIVIIAFNNNLISSDILNILQNNEFIIKPLYSIIAIPLITIIGLVIMNSVSSKFKEIIIFWKLKYALPGFRWQSKIARKDSKLNIEILNKKYGKNLSPQKQQDIWYKAYQRYKSDEGILESHKEYLFSRDLCTTTVLLIPIIVIIYLFSKIYFNLHISFLIINIIILISIFTGTSFYSYGIESRGFSGWFYSANEMSAIITIALPISLLYFNKSEKIYNILYFVFMCLLSIVVVAIGTKTSVLSVIIVQFFLCAISIIKKNKKVLFNMIVLLIIVFIELFIGDKIIDHFENFRVTPHKKYVNMSCPVKENFNSFIPVNDEKSDFEKFINKILSDRDSHLKENLLYMRKQPAINYLFGFSFDKSQDNKLSITLIEMDPFDSIFRFGIIGCILIYLPSILIFIQILLKIFKTKTIKLLTCHYLISFVLGIVISTLVGHVISAPAVSIYLTLSLILLYYSVSNCNKEE